MPQCTAPISVTPVPAVAPVRAAHLRRDETRVSVAAVVASTLAAHGISQREAATRMGLDHATWRETLAGLRPMHVERLARLGAHVASEVFEALAKSTREDSARTSVGPAVRSLRIAARVGELTGATEEAVRDGVVDDDERATLRARLHSVREEVDAAEREL